MRYLLRQADHLGTLHTVSRHYASDQNAIRYLGQILRGDAFPPGQYEITCWPLGSNKVSLHVSFLYKQV